MGRPAVVGAAGEPAAVWVPLDQIKPWKRNPRRNDAAARWLAAKIREFGFIPPVVVWRERNQMVGGHTRLKAMQIIARETPDFVPRGAPGPGLIAARFHDFKDEREAAAYALLDNKAVERAEWAPDELLSVATDFGIDLTDVGWTAPEVDALAGATERSSFGAMDGRPASAERKTMLTLMIAVEDSEAIERTLDEAMQEGESRGACLARLLRQP